METPQINTRSITLKKQRKQFKNFEKQKNLFPIYDMIVFSHLRWGFVYQRPQHLIKRLSKKYRILFIEEPIFPKTGDKQGYQLKEVTPRLSVLTPKVQTMAEIADLLVKLNINKVEVIWFYSPAFVGLLEHVSAETIIYDCMDELSMFKGASSALRFQEKDLIEMADLIFTGGISLYEEKSKHSSSVYCFPSSVELNHFKQARNEISIPEDIRFRQIKRPVIGYVGVIDERIDMQLLQNTADLSPQYDFVMIGPIVKIEKEDLAEGNNIHYLGMKPYALLPNYLSFFDVAMMPFAMNSATRFISPTKTLEYMAAGKPIVSTPIKDVVRQYKYCIDIIATPEDFKRSIEKKLDNDGLNYPVLYESILKHTSWDSTAAEMLKLIKELAQ